VSSWRCRACSRTARSRASRVPKWVEQHAGRGAGGTDRTAGLADDVEAVRKVLLDGDEPTIVVAHSYGGIVTADAATGVDSVRHLLLISSYLPEIGQSLSDFGDGSPAPFLDVDPGAGTFGVRPELLVDTFLSDCDTDVQTQAPAHLARQSVQVTGQSVAAAAWRQVPSTYLVCAQDKGTPARLQREFARRAGSSVEIEAGHHPFLSQPAAVRDLLLSLARG
jgi:pimeloyl-ACP methyl ester carboxylesterase